MIAAIYARKSTDQQGVTEDQKSVTRQERAREYAGRKGWTVSDEHVYIDDGISGAEFSKRPGLARLMNALKPRPTFQILILSEESRLGREELEVGYALKQILQPGVRVFFYLEDRERTLDSPTDKIMLSLTAFADELEREKARQRTYDAMQRKPAAGHVTGGYDNVTITTPTGQRSHVERRINQAEAVVVRRILELSGLGVGQTRIARQLNAEGAPAPRSQQGRPRAWSPSSVHEVLFRDLYRGVLTWNRSRKRNHWGQVEQKVRPKSDWMQVPAPALRIVSDEAWETAHHRLDAARAEYERVTGGPSAIGTPNTYWFLSRAAVRAMEACTFAAGRTVRSAPSSMPARRTISAGRRFVHTPLSGRWRLLTKRCSRRCGRGSRASHPRPWRKLAACSKPRPVRRNADAWPRNLRRLTAGWRGSPKPSPAVPTRCRR
jgi:site-specific DNA recombinase